MGTPDFAVPALAAIVAAGHDVAAVYTRAPKPKGRGQALAYSPVHAWADAHGVTVVTPATMRRDLGAAAAALAALKPDVVVVAAYGLILPSAVLAVPRLGCLNIHASLLPRWRGASPIHHAIWAGDDETGITIMQMDAGLDTGAMIRSASLQVGRATTPELEKRLAALGAELMVQVLTDLARDQKIDAIPQPQNGITQAPMLDKGMARINWTKPASMLDAQIRALVPWPGTETITPQGLVLKIVAAEPATEPAKRTDPVGTIMDRHGHVMCGDQTMLRVTRAQLPGGRPQTMADLINGGRLKIGDHLGAP
jgi:methionyl-tRNA formyltransferase